MHRNAEAEQRFRETLDTERRVLGPEQSDTLLKARIGGHARHATSLPEAVTLFRQTLALQIKVLTAHHPNTAHTERSLAQVLALRGKRDDAFVHLQACLDDGPAPSELQDSLADDALNSLHSDPRFAAIQSRAKQLTFVSSH
jgi:Tetratricopeptide repeat